MIEVHGGVLFLMAAYGFIAICVAARCNPGGLFWRSGNVSLEAALGIVICAVVWPVTVLCCWMEP